MNTTNNMHTALHNTQNDPHSTTPLLEHTNVEGNTSHESTLRDKMYTKTRAQDHHLPQGTKLEGTVDDKKAS